jgi:hypothetical protein
MQHQVNARAVKLLQACDQICERPPKPIDGPAQQRRIAGNRQSA